MVNTLNSNILKQVHKMLNGLSRFHYSMSLRYSTSANMLAKIAI